MELNASNFLKNRKRLSLTQLRVKRILACVIDSYEKIISDGVVYDYSKIGSIKKEDYLRNRLVDDYLEHELSLIESGTNNFTVNKETSEEYINLLDRQLHDDPIDIHIVDSALKDSWGQKTKPYFAIECKRLTSSVSSYVDDTKKTTQRDYSRLRLPFEGQLGFIENNSWNHSTVMKLINKNLLLNSHIETTKQLETFILKAKFEGSYLSEHKKKDKTLFSVLHLFLNYSKIVLN
jgi:hypothetical protein